MKKGWLCRESYDKKNQEIAPVMMIQQRWSRSSDDLDPVMMSGDDPDPMMKMTWRWQGLDDDPEDTEKKTCAKFFFERIPS